MNRTKILEIANKITKNTLMETLEIDYIDVGLDFLVATMPVSAKVHQPMGLLHGGATVALAESVGSAASHLLIDTNAFEVKGIEITANHLKSVKSGVVTATASVLHKGKTTHLWKIEIRDEDQNLISFCKLTNIVLPKSNK
jgi:1,4-dihydroxy-2-naphthoyl-CoA hydrolase